MSIAINFGSSPEEFHSVGDLGADIWDIIFTYKEIAEDAAIQHIVNKFKEISVRVLNIADGLQSHYQKEYCRANKIPMTYNGSKIDDDGDVAVVAVVFQQFHRKMPSVKNLPAKWKKQGLPNALVKECWEQEDINLFLIAMSFHTFHEVTPERFLKRWRRKDGIEYTGCPQFLQMGIDRSNEYHTRDWGIARRER